MQAADVMTIDVITVRPDAGVLVIADLLLMHRVSAVPVVDANQHVLGIVSEGDLIRRLEGQTDSRHSWWLETILSTQNNAGKYIKTHGQNAGDIMTRNVICVAENAPLYEIAGLLEKNHIKRVPVVRDKKLTGIVSRANLLHGLAANVSECPNVSSNDDQSIRKNLLHALSNEAGLDTALINVIVKDGVVQLWGLVNSDAEIKAAQIAAESTLGAKDIENHLGQVPIGVSAY